MKTQTIRAKERQTGSYGTVNAGDTVTVLDSTAEELLAGGMFEKVAKAEDTLTPEQVLERNASGVVTEPGHADGTNREILNTEGRKLHESGPDLIDEAAARAEAEVEPLPAGVSEKDEKTAGGRKTKEDKGAATEQTK